MLRLLGTPHVEVGGEGLPALPPKAYLLLAIVELEAGGTASRDTLTSLFWEDASQELAASRLRALLAKVRRWQERQAVPLVNASRTSVTAVGRSDAGQLLALRRIGTDEELATVLRLNRGHLLPAVGWAGATRLERVILRHRAAIDDHFLALVIPALERLGPEHAGPLLAQLRQRFPLDERVVRAGMLQDNTASGPRTAAASYRRFAARLHRESGSTPSLETLSLAAQLGAKDPGADVGDEGQAVDRGIPHIVLMPPAVTSGTPERLAALTAALIEDVTLVLCRMHTFAMYAPHTAGRIDRTSGLISAAPLGARFVGMTRVLPGPGGGFRLGLSIVDVRTRRIVLGTHFDLDERSLAVDFTAVAASVAGCVADAVERSELGHFRQTGSASAYVHYLLGSHALPSPDLRVLRAARQHFARAVELEPDYVPAIASIARTLVKESLVRRNTDPGMLHRALAMAERASNIDPSHPGGWRERAHASLYLRDLDESLALMQAASTRAPHVADILADTAEIYVHLSRPQEASRAIEAALALNPLAPDDYRWIKGSIEYMLCNYQRAVDELTLMGDPSDASRLLSAAAAMAGDLELAGKWRRRWMNQHPNSSLEDIESFLPQKGRRDVDHLVEGLRRAGFPSSRK